MNIAHLNSNETPESDRLAVWRDFFGRKMFRVDIDPLPEQRFFIDVTLRGLPGLTVVKARSSGARSRRTQDLIDDDGQLVLNIVHEGACVVSQRGDDVVCAPGEAILISSADPCTVLRPSTALVTTLSLPAKAIAPLVGDIQQAVMRRIPASSGALRLLTHYIETMPTALLSGNPDLQKIYVSHIYDLAALALGAGSLVDVAGPGRGLRAGRLQAIKHHIERHLQEPGLTPLSTATAVGISVRQLHQLFEPLGVSFKRYVTARRLEHCRRMLSRPADRHRSIADIAFHSGFDSLATFYRAFKSTYNCMPAACRMDGNAD